MPEQDALTDDQRRKVEEFVVGKGGGDALGADPQAESLARLHLQRLRGGAWGGDQAGGGGAQACVAA